MYFEFTTDAILYGFVYKKGDKLTVGRDCGIYDETGRWLFDCHSESAEKYGVIKEKDWGI